MHEIICPHCSKAFKIDEAGYADILKQVRDSEFDHELHDRLALAEDNGLALDAYRFDKLDMLFELAARSQLMEVSYGIGSMH